MCREKNERIQSSKIKRIEIHKRLHTFAYKMKLIFVNKETRGLSYKLASNKKK